MNVQTKEPADQAAALAKLPMPPKFATHAQERLHRKQRLAAGFRLFSKFGFDEGVAGISPPATPSSRTPSGSIRSACISA